METEEQAPAAMGQIKAAEEQAPAANDPRAAAKPKKTPLGQIKTELIKAKAVAAPPLKRPPPKAEGADPPKAGGNQISYNAAKARWRRSMPNWVDDRTCVPQSSHGNGNKIPPEVYAEMVAGGPAEEKRLFDVYRRNGCDWDAAEIIESVDNSHRNIDKSDWAWCTRDQAAFILQNRAVADAKCDVAGKDPNRFKVDEDCPEMAEAHLYYIKIKEGKSELRIKDHTKRTRTSASASDEQAAAISRTILPANLAAGKYVSPHVKAGQPSPQAPAASTEEEKKKAEEEAAAAKAKEEAEAAEKEKKKQAAAKAKAEAKAKLQSSPAYQVGKWLSGMSDLMRQCDENVGKAKSSDKIPTALTKQYQEQFGQSRINLKTLRDQLEAADPSASGTCHVLSDANRKVTKLQEDIKAFSLLWQAYHPPRQKQRPRGGRRQQRRRRQQKHSGFRAVIKGSVRLASVYNFQPRAPEVAAVSKDTRDTRRPSSSESKSRTPQQHIIHDVLRYALFCFDCYIAVFECDIATFDCYIALSVCIAIFDCYIALFDFSSLYLIVTSLYLIATSLSLIVTSLYLCASLYLILTTIYLIAHRCVMHFAPPTPPHPQ